MNSNRVDERCVDLTLSNNMSRKQLQAKMITNRRTINYNNSRIQSIYNTILNTTYTENEHLSRVIGNDTYRYYWDKLFYSSKILQYKKRKIFEYRTLAYPIVYDIPFPPYNGETYVISNDDHVYIYGDLSGNQINGLTEYNGDVPAIVYGNNIYILNIDNVIHTTIQLTNKNNIQTILNVTFHKQITYIYPNKNVVYYVYSSESSVYGGSTGTYYTQLIVNDISSWNSYIERPFTKVFTRVGDRIDMRCSLSKDTYIEINSTNQIAETVNAYIEDSKLYLSKTHIGSNDFNVSGITVINIYNLYGVMISIQSTFYRGIFQDYRVPKWIFVLSGQYTYASNSLDVNDLDSWETFLQYDP
tara:strand:- start:3172 stop:4245 length:1074 start_codon:yes stop_codon:yes gene_type:complete